MFVKIIPTVYVCNEKFVNALLVRKVAVHIASNALSHGISTLAYTYSMKDGKRTVHQHSDNLF